MKLRHFLHRLRPVFATDKVQWQGALADYDAKFSQRAPELFWYLASGFDWKALVRFSENETSRRYRTPKVDFFLMTDYIVMQPGNFVTPNSIRHFYEQLDRGPVTLFRDGRTRITLEQAIPLWYFSPEEIQVFKKAAAPRAILNGFLGHFHEKLDALYCHFCYAYVTIESHAFRREYVPVLLSPFENVFARDETFVPEQILFRYLCSVCDGCGLGGAYQCSAQHYRDFLPVLHPDQRYWVCDHIRQRIPKEEYRDYFPPVDTLEGWGNYGSPFKRSILYSLSPNC